MRWSAVAILIPYSLSSMFTIGIDEAGYGPNLGPLVQAAAVVRSADDVDLGAALKPCVRRADEAEDGRALIDDSKLIHVGTRGLERLERAVIGGLVGPQMLGPWLERIACGTSREDLAAEPWYRADDSCPVAVEAAATDSAVPERFRACCRRHGVEWITERVVITPASRFNALLAGLDSKAAVLGRGLSTLLADGDRARPGSEPLEFVIDKQGGRAFYAPMIQTAFPDGWVTPLEESADRSVYRIDRLRRPVRLTFTPRADGSSIVVAAASMIAKYLREVLMRQFNQFWQDRVPNLEPTAGYPNDSKRFYGLIQRSMRELGIRADQVWRER